MPDLPPYPQSRIEKLYNILAGSPYDVPNEPILSREEAWLEYLAEHGGGGGIPEAPIDGEQYARQNGAWSIVEGGSGDVPSEAIAPEYDETQTYVEGDLAWKDGTLKEYDGANWNEAAVSDILGEKQDTISDLEDIREGAALGETAYQKPETGIPDADIASADNWNAKQDDILELEEEIPYKIVGPNDDKIIFKKDDVVNNNIPVFDENGDIKDSGDKLSDYIPYADTDALKNMMENVVEDENSSYFLKEPSSGLAVGKYFRIASIDFTGRAVLEVVDNPAIVKGIKINNVSIDPDDNGVVNILPVKSTIDSVLVPGAQYYLGEQSAVDLTLPSTAELGQQIVVCFSSGATAATLTCSLTGFDFVPKANTTNRLVFILIHKADSEVVGDEDQWSVEVKEG